MLKFLLLSIVLFLSSGHSIACAAQEQKSTAVIDQKTVTKAVTSEKKETDKPEEKKNNSLFNSVTNAVSNTLKGAADLMDVKKLLSEGQADIPRTIAILPATGKGDSTEHDDVRLAIHNHFSSKNFDLIKPQLIDQKLALLNVSDRLSAIVENQPPDVIAKQLGVEGLVYVELTEVSKVYAAAYAHYELSVRLKFYDAKKHKFFWKKEESIAEREGGISLNPLSFIATAISSASVLTDAARQTLVDQLARRFANVIPFPIGTKKSVKPPSISLAITNNSEGPFKAGSEITVFLKAESGLAATFDLGQDIKGNVLEEKSQGEYVGRYVVPNNTNYNDLIVRVNALRVSDSASIVWTVPGKITIDSTPPSDLTNMVAKPVNNAIHISWDLPKISNEKLTYVVEKADAKSGQYVFLTDLEINEFNDEAVNSGEAYHYRVFAKDLAGNKSNFSSIKATAVKAGPTDISNDITQNTTFYAMASPYRINQPIRLLRQAQLTLEPGVVIEFGEQSSIDVLGKIVARGSEKAPIVMKGNHWQLHFNDNGTNSSDFEFTQIEQGTLGLNNSSLKLANCRISKSKVAIQLINNSHLAIENCQLQQNDIALETDNSAIILNKVRFSENSLAWKNKRVTLQTLSKVTFSNNDKLIESGQSLVLNSVIFENLTYQEVMNQLPDTVKVSWQKDESKHNLQQAWLQKQWPDLLSKTETTDWDKTYQQVNSLLKQAPNAESLNTFKMILAAYLGKKVTVENQPKLVNVIKQNRQEHNQGKLWVQTFKIPHLKNSIFTDNFILKKATPKISTDYLKQEFPRLTARDIRKYKRKIKISASILGSQILYNYRQGMFDYVAVAHYMDNSKLTRELSIAGLIRAQKSTMVVGLLNNSSLFELDELLNNALAEQGIKTVSVGHGDYGKPAVAKAKRLGADILLAASLMSNKTQSNISQNISMIDLNLSLTSYDLYTQELLKRLTASANAAGFKQHQTETKALSKAFLQLKNNLVEQLWSANTLVANHHVAIKKEQQRLARIKAEKERAEKIRIAKAKKAREEKEKQERLAKEQLEKERLEKERIEQEKIAQQKKQQEQLAREQATKEAAAKKHLTAETAGKEIEHQSDALTIQTPEKETIPAKTVSTETKLSVKGAIEKQSKENKSAETTSKLKVINKNVPITTLPAQVTPAVSSIKIKSKI